jgi:hypothetical protein
MVQAWADEPVALTGRDSCSVGLLGWVIPGLFYDDRGLQRLPQAAGAAAPAGALGGVDPYLVATWATPPGHHMSPSEHPRATGKHQWRAPMIWTCSAAATVGPSEPSTRSSGAVKNQ